MKKKTLTVVVICGLLVLAIAGYFGSMILTDNYGSMQTLTENEYFRVEGDRVAIVYNHGLQSATGLYRNGEVYLPLSWVSSVLNDKFYFDGQKDLLIYTLPDSILYSDLQTMGSLGNPLLLKEEEKVYISVNIVKTYTDMYSEAFTETAARRIFINSEFSEYKSASLRRGQRLRAEATGKSPIVREVEKGEILRLVLDDLSDGYYASEDLEWVKVVTSDGCMGYLRKKELTGIQRMVHKTGFRAPEYTSISLGEPVILGWHQVLSAEGNASIDSLLASSEGLNVISPTWFSLSDNAGNYTSLASPEYVAKAHRSGVQVWVLVDNFSKDVSTQTLLLDTDARKRLIEGMVAEVLELGIDGINIDFEYLKEGASRQYIQFIREMSVACRQNDIILSVDVPSYAVFNTHYERGKLGEVVDYVINMAYDEHYSGSPMGSVASYGFVREGLLGTLSQVPAQKIINAMPLYTRIWTTEGSGVTSKAVGIAAAKAWIEETGLSLSWDDKVGQFYGEVATEKGTAHIWMEEERSLSLKVGLAKEFGIAGVALWRLGLEPAEVWPVIRGE